MRSQYPSVLPVEITERVKNIDNIYKIANIKLTPINKTYPLVSTEAPRVEIYFPSDSVLNLQNAILEANITFNHLGNGNAADRANNHVQGLYPPRYGLASLIEEVNVYINGIQASTTKKYNYVHNWVRDWLSSFDVEINEGLNDCQDPSMLYTRPTGGGMSGLVVPRRGFPVCVWNDNAANNDVNARQRMNYHLNLSDSVGFFAEGSSKILNTALLGEIKLEIIFTSQIATCIAGSAVGANIAATSYFGHIFPQTGNQLRGTLNTADTKGADAGGTTGAISFARNNVEVATGGVVFGDTGVPTLGCTNAARSGVLTAGAGDNQLAAIAPETQQFSIRDVVLHMEALQFKTSDYYDIMNRLVDSGAYKYHFKRYVIQTDAATTTRQVDYRMVVNSECLNYVLATFRPNGYDTLANPVNSLIAPPCVGHCGTLNATLPQQVSAGLPYTFNNSKFFIRNGLRVARCGWKVDETYFEPRTKQELYMDNIRHWRYYNNGEQTKPHVGLKNYWDFVHCYFTAILSFETKSEDDVKSVYNLRGLNTNGKAISISCFTETEDANYTAQNTAQGSLVPGSGVNVDASTNTLTYPINIRGFSQINLDPAGAAIPTFLICTTTTLELKGRREVDIKY